MYEYAREQLEYQLELAKANLGQEIDKRDKIKTDLQNAEIMVGIKQKTAEDLLAAIRLLASQGEPKDPGPSTTGPKKIENADGKSRWPFEDELEEDDSLPDEEDEED